MHLSLNAWKCNECMEMQETKRTEMEKRKHDREMQMQMQMQEHDREMQERENERQERLEMARINLQLNRQIPQLRANAQPTFKVEVAAKLLPKLGADHELEVYLITFQKIAKLNWPKKYWPAILQTQLKGKALCIFAELLDDTIKDFDRLQKALLAAYELSPEHYRKKFCDLKKGDSESHTDFAFKMLVTETFKHFVIQVQGNH